ncbi:MAG: hypothetical protein H0T90_09165 [Gemmatimonadales bacterium]|nr:hypothetical protein [Gemmatimonadales bacterium]
MPRALTISRVRVREGAEGEYLAAVRELAALAESRGWHLWLFRRPGAPRLYLECSESPSPETHRSLAERPDDERRLEDRIRSAAEYEGDDAWEIWESA